VSVTAKHDIQGEMRLELSPFAPVTLWRGWGFRCEGPEGRLRNQRQPLSDALSRFGLVRMQNNPLITRRG
jgi:hypothetical protein